MARQGTFGIASGFCVLQSYKTKVPSLRKLNEELCLDVWAGILSVTFDVCIVGVAKLFASASFIINSEKNGRQTISTVLFGQL